VGSAISRVLGDGATAFFAIFNGWCLRRDRNAFIRRCRAVMSNWDLPLTAYAFYLSYQSDRRCRSCTIDTSRRWLPRRWLPRRWLAGGGRRQERVKKAEKKSFQVLPEPCVMHSSTAITPRGVWELKALHTNLCKSALYRGRKCAIWIVSFNEC
jgi:hypothetical protein